MPFTSWANAFVEVAKFSLLHSAKASLVEFLLQEVTLSSANLFNPFCFRSLGSSTLACSRRTHSPERAASDETMGHFEQFRKYFRLNVVNKVRILTDF